MEIKKVLFEIHSSFYIANQQLVIIPGWCNKTWKVATINQCLELEKYCCGIHNSFQRLLIVTNVFIKLGIGVKFQWKIECYAVKLN